VLAAPGSSPANIPAGTIDQRHISLVAACTAAGQMLPSVYICAGQHVTEVRMPARWRATVSCMHARGALTAAATGRGGLRTATQQSWETDKMRHDSKFAVSDHGGMTKQLFNDLLTGHIGQWLLKHGPKVILIDGDGSHEPQSQTVQWLVDHGIHLFRLPAHLTHRLCPLDVSVFGPLKAYFRRILRQELRKGKIHVGVADRWRFMDEALQEVAPRTVSRGWQRAGLYPFNENIWKVEGWAETSAALTPSPKPAPPAVRRSRRLQQEELGRYLLSKTPSVEEKDECIRQYIREYPSEHDILQAALPQAPALQGTRCRGRLRTPR
jgi:hypothetical protein